MDSLNQFTPKIYIRAYNYGTIDFAPNASIVMLELKAFGGGDLSTFSPSIIMDGATQFGWGNGSPIGGAETYLQVPSIGVISVVSGGYGDGSGKIRANFQSQDGSDGATTVSGLIFKNGIYISGTPTDIFPDLTVHSTYTYSVWSRTIVTEQAFYGSGAYTMSESVIFRAWARTTGLVWDAVPQTAPATSVESFSYDSFFLSGTCSSGGDRFVIQRSFDGGVTFPDYYDTGSGAGGSFSFLDDGTTGWVTGTYDFSEPTVANTKVNWTDGSSFLWALYSTYGAVRATGYYSSDGSEGATGTATSANTLTIKDGLVTHIA